LEFVAEYGLFLAKTVTFMVAILVLIGSLVSAGSKLKKAEKKGYIDVEKLNDHYEEMKEILLSNTQSHHEFKKYIKDKKKQDKENEKKEKHQAHEITDHPRKKRIFVLDFYGDIKASEASALEQVVSAIVCVATPNDEVVVRLESAGGMVHSYGLASSQLARFRSKKIPLTICVDKVAASGGYMMACIGSKIYAAPFAIIGSIGVLAQIPNFHRLLKKHDIDYELITAGEYKRTLTIFGENTDKGREKFIEEIQDTHELFKDFIKEYRPAVNVADVATGEVWFGTRALHKGLVDEIRTSEEYLLDAAHTADIFKIEFIEKRSLQERLGLAARHATISALDAILHKDRESQIFR
jgi:serine protease SohB